MVDPINLERAILNVVSSAQPDSWISFSMGDLRNSLGQFDDSLRAVSFQEVVDCLGSLEGQNLLALRKFFGTSHTPFNRSLFTTDPYVGQFFGIGSFEVKLTHEGRKALTRVEIKVETNVDTYDDKLPLFRKKFFDADLQKFVEQSRSSSRPIALVMVDLDRFKQVNDQFGHPAGDAVLLGISTILADFVQGKGKAYRYGGEEIAIALPNYTLSEAITLAEAMRVQIEKSQLTDRKLDVTASFGLAVLPQHAEDAKNLLDLADAALLAAKKLGRNLVRVSGEPNEIKAERTPDRRQPDPSDLSDEQRQAIRLAYFRTHLARCPKDDARLSVHESQTMDSRTPTLIVSCPLCGLQEFLEGS